MNYMYDEKDIASVDAETCIAAAAMHSATEISDLQGYLRTMWGLLSPAQKTVFGAMDANIARFEKGVPHEFFAPAPDKDMLIAVFGLHGEHPEQPRGMWASALATTDTKERDYWTWVAEHGPLVKIGKQSQQAPPQPPRRTPRELVFKPIPPAPP